MKSTSIDEKVYAFLHNRYTASKDYQEGQNRIFNISFNEYCKIWKRSLYQLARLKERILMNDAWEFMASDDGYVLTWKDKAAFKAGIINAETMEIKTRKKSKRVCHMQPGETHRPESIEKIRKARTGTMQSPSVRQAIGRALKGQPKSAEHKAKMKAAALARHARRREQTQNPIETESDFPFNGKSSVNQLTALSQIPIQ
ncbi:hypothetical protein [Methylobacterium sp. WL120]|uniref:hypothetical protein n=1 Tax=Methylobacterium sp. WL120 TaxID=2603887 RepID=UPI0011C9D434|nr:hypothetical protein [Methylobacterium sp. WL120]TXM70891.1 hypothetical protein FV229_01470 [Methylobacterium sp. WL120]